MAEMLRKIATAQLVKSQRPDLVYFPIYSPWVVDSYDEAIMDKSLEWSAHDWMMRHRTGNVDINHDGEAVNSRVVESLISHPSDTRFPIAGTWAGAMKIFDPQIVDAVEAGVINGVSLLSEYPPLRTKMPTVVKSPVVARGVTEISLEPRVPTHSHSIELRFDQQSREVPGVTVESLAHAHPYKFMDATEMAGATQGLVDHAHRICWDRLEWEYETRLQVVTWMTSLSVIAISLVDHGANGMPIVGMKRRATEVIEWPDSTFRQS